MNQEKTLEEKLRELSLDDLNKWTVGYITQRSNFNTKGLKCSDETRAKLSKASMGKKPSDETRAKLSKANMGKKPSDETKAKIGKAHKGKVVSDETKRKLSDFFTKLNHSQILEIQSKYAPFKYGAAKLAKEYGVHINTIYKYIRKT